MTSNGNNNNNNIFIYKNIKYIIKDDVLYRLSNDHLFNSEKYNNINIPAKYRGITRENFIETKENSYLKHKITDFINNYYDLTENGFIFIKQSGIDMIGTQASCVLLNELFLKGIDSLYYRSIYQFGEYIINNKKDFFVELFKVKHLVIDNIDKISKIPVLNLKTVLYYLEWILKERFLNNFSTILISELEFDTLINILGGDLFAFIANNIKLKMVL